MLRSALAFTVVIAATFSADSAVAQATGSRLQAIASSKTVKIAYRSDAMPFSYVQNNDVVGYTVDICKAVVASLEKQLKVQPLNVQLVPVTTQTRFEAVASGKADLECGSSTVTLSRMREVDFSSYVFVESTGLVVKSTANAVKLQDLAGKKIAVIAGTSNEKAMAAVNEKAQLNATFVPVKDREDAVAALDAGRADAFASDKLLLVGTQFKDMQAFRMLPDDLSVEPYAIVLPRGDWQMRLAVNTALAELYRTGAVLKIFDQWFGRLGLRPGLLLGAAYTLGGLPD
ncbi:MAG: amino acid ABC transporter substrate-binding protein [Xanthobacteraceae bacterium]|nr:amino acid ABC transporter substrate-binding protein [Xanthobacteraceae bacterium]